MECKICGERFKHTFFIRTQQFLPSLDVLNFFMIIGSNVLKIVLILRVILLLIFERLLAVYSF